MSLFYAVIMAILSQAHCPTTYHIKIGAIEASQSRNNNKP